MNIINCTETEMLDSLGIGYQREVIIRKLRLTEETKETNFTQGLTIKHFYENKENFLYIYVPDGKIYRIHSLSIE